MALSVKVEAFEGPLDLLLELIEKNKLDIYDIPMAQVCRQYMEALERLPVFDMELGSEFLLLGSTLLYIKSRLLLPKQTGGDEEDEEDPREKLVAMLLEYRRFKELAAQLLDRQRAASLYYSRPALYSALGEKTLEPLPLVALLQALAAVLDESGEALGYIEPQSYSMEEKMEEILHLLRQARQGLDFARLFDSGSRAEKVVSFLGILELLRLGAVRISQSRAFGPIYIFPKEAENG